MPVDSGKGCGCDAGGSHGEGGAQGFLHLLGCLEGEGGQGREVVGLPSTLGIRVGTEDLQELGSIPGQGACATGDDQDHRHEQDRRQDLGPGQRRGRGGGPGKSSQESDRLQLHQEESRGEPQGRQALPPGGGLAGQPNGDADHDSQGKGCNRAESSHAVGGVRQVDHGHDQAHGKGGKTLAEQAAADDRADSHVGISAICCFAELVGESAGVLGVAKGGGDSPPLVQGQQ